MGLGNTIYFLLAISTTCLTSKAKKPNIVFIVGDDLGWNDVSLHGSDQIPTPNMDLLGFTGVVLRRYYSHAICTPSRSALLTGKYSHRIGMQGYPLSMAEDRGIPVTEKLLPQYLKEAGYSTHLVGKWHVGSSRNEFLPTSRGFDSHYGHRGGYTDYYEYTIEETLSSVGTVCGLPLFKNLTPAWDVEGYITDVYTDRATAIINEHDASSPLFLMVAHNAPHASNAAASLQAPPKDVREMRHIELVSRRIFAAMVSKLDKSVGEIVEALYEKGILENTIITFVSDNGGMTSGELQNFASNYPLRGIKMSPFEGGIRVTGVMWSANLNNSDHFWDGYMHVSDWLPTLLTAAGVEVPSGINGINQWENINSNAASDRTEMYEIDDYAGFASMILGDYKLVTGNVDIAISDYQGADLRAKMGEEPSYSNAISSSAVYKVLKLLGRPFNMTNLSRLRRKAVIECDSTSNSTCQPSDSISCLYNIIEDPCETTDLSNVHPELVEEMTILLQKEYATRIPRKLPVYRDPLAVPRAENNFTWNTWVPDSAPF